MVKLYQEGYFFLPGYTNLDWLFAAKAVLVSLETINVNSKVYGIFLICIACPEDLELFNDANKIKLF